MNRIVMGMKLLVGLVLASPILAQDDHGDSCVAATPVALNRPTRIAIETPGDVDYLVVQVHAGRHYVVETGFTSVGFAPRLTLQGHDCATGGPEPIESYYPREYFATEDGSMYVRLSADVGSPMNVGICRVSVTETGPWADDHGRTPETATELEVGGDAVGAVYDYWLDADYFRVACTPGSTYRMTIVSDNPNGPTLWMVVHGSDPAQRLFAANASFYGQNHRQEFVFFVPPSNEAVLYVRVWYWSDYGVGRGYQLGIEEIAHHDGPDDHADTCEGATDLGVGEWVDASIDTLEDTDFFAVRVERDHRYAIEIDTLLGERYSDFSPRIAVRDEACGVMVDTRVHNGVTYSFRAVEDGVVYLQLVRSPFDGTGSCRIGVAEVEGFEDDHADGPEGAAVLIPDGTPMSGTITGSLDRDAVGVDLEERMLYAVDLRDPAESGRVSAYVDSPDGHARGRISGYANILKDGWARGYVYVPPGGEGRHTLVVNGWAENHAWDIRVVPIEPREPGKDVSGECDGAAVVPLDIWFPVTVDNESDIDAVAFPTIAGHMYTIESRYRTAYLEQSWLESCENGWGCGGCFDIPFRARDTGVATVFLGVQNGARTGTTDFHITDTGPLPDDHGDSPTTATHILPDATIHHGTSTPIDVLGDFDWFGVRFDEPGEYVIRLSNDGDRYGIAMGQVYARDGVSWLASLNDWSEGWIDEEEERRILITPQLTGEYFVMVLGHSSVERTYVVQVRRACDADFTRDGRADSADFFAYVQAFFEPWRADADFDHDGNVTSMDFFAFLDAFLAGCAG